MKKALAILALVAACGALCGLGAVRTRKYVIAGV
jgi:hypothetical protein